MEDTEILRPNKKKSYGNVSWIFFIIMVQAVIFITFYLFLITNKNIEEKTKMCKNSCDSKRFVSVSISTSSYECVCTEWTYDNDVDYQ